MCSFVRVCVRVANGLHFRCGHGVLAMWLCYHYPSLLFIILYSLVITATNTNKCNNTGETLRNASRLYPGRPAGRRHSALGFAFKAFSSFSLLLLLFPVTLLQCPTDGAAVHYCHYTLKLCCNSPNINLSFNKQVLTWNLIIVPSLVVEVCWSSPYYTSFSSCSEWF